MIWNNPKKILLICALFIISFLLRWGYINGTYMVDPFSADARLYALLAYNLAEHGAYSTDLAPNVKSSPNTRDPGYPFFLAAIVKISDSVTDFFLTTCWIQSILGAFTVLLSYCLARFFLTTLWSGLVSVLTMVSPHLISMTNYVLTETLFTFLLLSGIVLYLYALKRSSVWLIVFSGLAFGLAVCVRSVLQLFPFIVAAITYFYFRQRRKKATGYALLILVASLAFFVPWKVWSHLAFRGMEPSPSTLKEALYVGSYKGLIYNGVPQNQLKGGIGMPYMDDPDYERVLNGGYDRIFEEIGKRFAENPISYSLWWISGKPAMFWGWNMVHDGGDINVYSNWFTWYDKNKLMNLTKKIMWLLHPVIIMLMYLGAILFLVRRKTYAKTYYIMAISILLLLFYFVSIHTILVPAPRYSIPLRPFTYLIAVLGVAGLTGKIKRERDHYPSK